MDFSWISGLAPFGSERGHCTGLFAETRQGSGRPRSWSDGMKAPREPEERVCCGWAEPSPGVTKSSAVDVLWGPRRPDDPLPTGSDGF